MGTLVEEERGRERSCELLRGPSLQAKKLIHAASMESHQRFLGSGPHGHLLFYKGGFGLEGGGGLEAKSPIAVVLVRDGA